jgi:2-polyprenyl-3-methyl-5-hydroxy-6-metoxy-1,4-benzoquinol methylase
MWPDLSVRSEAVELMDDRSIVGTELLEALRQLRWINRVLGAAWPTLEGVATLWRRAGRPRRLTLLDVGAGSGDVNRLLLRWAAWRRIDLRITLVDLHPDTCATAAAHFENEPGVQVVCADLFRLPLRNVDIVTASLVLHHIPTVQLPLVVNTMIEAARIGVVINDLHRHVVAWAAIWTATRVFSRNRMLRYDAPLSVRRGFRRADFARLQTAAHVTKLWYSWRPWFRYLVVVPTATGH